MHMFCIKCITTFLMIVDDVVIAGGEAGVHFTMSREGRPSGEAFVELIDEENAQAATEKHNEHMGTRYIESNKTVLTRKI